MCLAVFRPPNAVKRVLASELEISLADGNGRDGFGLMWAQNDELKIWKSAKARHWPTFLSIVESVQDANLPMAVHLRLATHGKVEWNNAHPIEVVPDQMALIHNGVFSEFAKDRDKLDSRQFADMLRDLPDGWSDSETIWKLLRGFVGYSNKVVLLDRHGGWTILGESNGHWTDGTWYSNSSYKAWHRQSKHQSSSNGVVDTKPVAQLEPEKQGKVQVWTPRTPYKFSWGSGCVVVCVKCVKDSEAMFGSMGTPYIGKYDPEATCEYCSGSLYPLVEIH